MALNRHRAEGNQVKVPVPSGVESGELVVLGSGATRLVGVALIDRDADGEATLQFDGTWRFTHTATATLAVGDAIYVTGGGAISQTASGNTLVGNAMTALANGATGDVEIRLSN